MTWCGAKVADAGHADPVAAAPAGAGLCAPETVETGRGSPTNRYRLVTVQKPHGACGPAASANYRATAPENGIRSAVGSTRTA